GSLERDDTRERHIEPEGDAGACEVTRAGEAMEHRGKGALPGFLREDARHVGVGLATMNDQRQAGLARSRDVRAQPLFLRVARAEVIMIVEPRLPDRDHLVMLRSLDQLGGGNIQFLMRVMWMRADRAVHIGKTFGDRHHLGVPTHARRNGDNEADLLAAARATIASSSEPKSGKSR